MFQWETRLAEFPTGTFDQRVCNFLLSMKISDRFFFSYAIKKTVSSSLVAHMEMPERNGER